MRHWNQESIALVTGFSNKFNCDIPRAKLLADFFRDPRTFLTDTVIDFGIERLATHPVKDGVCLWIGNFGFDAHV